MEKHKKLLPVVKVGDKEFLVDIDRREFREVSDPDCHIDMHSREGRDMVSTINGQEWRVYRLDNLAPNGSIHQTASN